MAEKTTGKGREPEKLSPREEMEKLRKRFETLDRKRIQTETSLAHAEKDLKTLQEKAREEFGTDDPEELARRLEEMRAENERLCREYREHLDAIESGLNDIDRRYRESRQEGGA
ncbi:MAG TPA: hypothetical protein PLB62_02410 [Candidatus Sumerlaeota bacterium]|nr:hypothetical protein [Candidatus Sumerlaeota bacterium]